MTCRLDKQTSSKRIAINTIVLYFRMFIMTLISLYTSRIVLNALGIDDFGIYNVVGGVVALLGLLSNSMSNAIGRYLTIELGHGDLKKLNLVFSTSVNVMFIIAFLIFVIGEIIGLWFVQCKMNVPIGREEAAMWTFQCSLLTFIITIISIPYSSIIVAHERMSAFAYVSIFEALLKLAIAALLFLSTYDKLKVYSLLMLMSSVCIRIVYSVYCEKNFEESKFRFVLDRSLLKGMFGFAGWNFVDFGAYVINNFGTDIVINLFFGVSLNAAKGIASQVNGAVTRFSKSFTTAINPQIYKSFARGELISMHNLIFRGAKFSFYLMLLFVIPLCLETETILSLWLKHVPSYAPFFVRFTLLITIARTLTGTLETSLYATGKLKKYMLVVGTFDMLNIPVIYGVLCYIKQPEIIYYVWFFNSVLLVLLRLRMTHKLISLSCVKYICKVYLPVLQVTLFSLFLPIVFCCVFGNYTFRIFITVILSTLSIMVSVYVLGLDPHEKNKIKCVLLNFFKHYVL